MQSWEFNLWTEEKIVEFAEIWKRSTTLHEVEEALDESRLLNGHFGYDKGGNKISWNDKNIGEVRLCLNRAFAREEIPIKLESLPWRHEPNWQDIALKILFK